MNDVHLLKVNKTKPLFLFHPPLNREKEWTKRLWTRASKAILTQVWTQSAQVSKLKHWTHLRFRCTASSFILFASFHEEKLLSPSWAHRSAPLSSLWRASWCCGEVSHDVLQICQTAARETMDTGGLTHQHKQKKYNNLPQLGFVSAPTNNNWWAWCTDLTDANIWICCPNSYLTIGGVFVVRNKLIVHLFYGF